MGFNSLKARATLRRQFTFYHQIHRNSWYSFYWPWKDERVNWPWKAGSKIHISWTAGCWKLVDHSKFTTQDLPWVFSDMYALQTTGSALKILIFRGGGLIAYNGEVVRFFTSREPQSKKVGWPLKMTTRIDLLLAFWDMFTP